MPGGGAAILPSSISGILSFWTRPIDKMTYLALKSPTISSGFAAAELENALKKVTTGESISLIN
jgi:hypothetical protein